MAFFQNSVLNKYLKAQDVKRVDSEIEQVVYQLYGLTDDEINIVKDRK